MPTISEQLTQLISDRDDLVDNLTTKGITGLTGDETFTELVPEVLNIQTGGGIDWSQIGYSSEPEMLIEGFNYAKTIYDNWNSSQTSLSQKFYRDKKLLLMPLVDSGNATNFYSMFGSCVRLFNMPLLNTSNGTNFSYMFESCSALSTIPLIDVSKGTNFSYMFNSCLSLESIPNLDTKSGLNFSSMFGSCQELKVIPSINTSNGTNFSNMCFACNSLTTVNELDMSSATNVSAMFYICNSITTVYGLLNLGKAFLTSKSANYYEYEVNFSTSSRIDHNSLMNIINNLYDIATAGCNTQRLVLGSSNLAKLTAEEIAIATNRGWSIS